MTATISQPITEQEYLQLEERATVRHEFINGKMYEMPGGTSFHEKVISNILRILFSVTTLEVYAQGFRVKPPDTKNYYYPDVIVAEEETEKKTYTDKPLMLAEVLSPSTRVRVNDLTDKFIAYRSFPTLEYYLLVEPDFCRVNLFYKSENGDWEMEEYNQLEDIVDLPKLAIRLPLSSIYAGLKWTKNA